MVTQHHYHHHRPINPIPQTDLPTDRPAVRIGCLCIDRWPRWMDGTNAVAAAVGGGTGRVVVWGWIAGWLADSMVDTVA